MKIGRWQITKLPDLPKRTRKLPLDKFYTFPCGTAIYTYRDADLPLISGRYYDQVKVELQFLAEYGIDKETVKKYDDAIQDLVAKGLNGQLQKGEVLADIKRIIDEKSSLFKYNEELHYNMWLNLYCFFFVLDGEDECHFSEAENNKKIELLKSLPEVEQDVFFSYLEKRLEYYRDGLTSDITNYMMTLAESATKIKGGNLADSLNMLTSMMNSSSKSADGRG